MTSRARALPPATVTPGLRTDLPRGRSGPGGIALREANDRKDSFSAAGRTPERNCRRARVLADAPPGGHRGGGMPTEAGRRRVADDRAMDRAAPAGRARA